MTIVSELPYIFRSIIRAHKLVALTEIALIAFAFMVVGNAAPVIFSTAHSLYSTSGIRESNLGVLHFEIGSTGDDVPHPLAVVDELRSTDGVAGAAVVSSLPLENRALTFNPLRELGQNAVPKAVTAYLGSSGFMDILGVRLQRGRGFQPDEYAGIKGMWPGSNVTIVSRDLADYLWPNSDPLGKLLVASNDHTYRVVGVADRVAGSHPSSLADKQLVAFFPTSPGPNLNDTYIFSLEPTADRRKVFNAVAERMHKAFPLAAYSRPVTFEEIRAQYFSKEVRAAWSFGLVCIAVTITMAVGVGALAAFWIEQRRRSIAIRRALGAPQARIIAYFVAENGALSMVGILLGATLALFANQWLLQHFELQRVNIYYFVLGGAAFFLINLLSISNSLRRCVSIDLARALA